MIIAGAITNFNLFIDFDQEHHLAIDSNHEICTSPRTSWLNLRAAPSLKPGEVMYDVVDIRVSCIAGMDIISCGGGANLKGVAAKLARVRLWLINVLRNVLATYIFLGNFWSGLLQPQACPDAAPGDVQPTWV